MPDEIEYLVPDIICRGALVTTFDDAEPRSHQRQLDSVRPATTGLFLHACVLSRSRESLLCARAATRSERSMKVDPIPAETMAKTRTHVCAGELRRTQTRPTAKPTRLIRRHNPR